MTKRHLTERTFKKTGAVRFFDDGRHTSMQDFNGTLMAYDRCDVIVEHGERFDRIHYFLYQ